MSEFQYPGEYSATPTINAYSYPGENQLAADAGANAAKDNSQLWKAGLIALSEIIKNRRQGQVVNVNPRAGNRGDLGAPGPFTQGGPGSPGMGAQLPMLGQLLQGR